MTELSNLKEENLNLIYYFVKFNPDKKEGVLYDITSLKNNNYTKDDISKQMSNLLFFRNEVVSERKMDVLNKNKIIKLDYSGLDTSDLMNPFLSLEQLKFLIEFKKQDIYISYVVNENLSIEEMGTIINYIIIYGYNESFEVIKYMSRASLEILLNMINKSEDICDFILEYIEERNKIITEIEDYELKYKNKENRGLSHANIVKVYTVNRYKKNN